MGFELVLRLLLDRRQRYSDSNGAAHPKARSWTRALPLPIGRNEFKTGNLANVDLSILQEIVQEYAFSRSQRQAGRLSLADWRCRTVSQSQPCCKGDSRISSTIFFNTNSQWDILSV